MAGGSLVGVLVTADLAGAALGSRRHDPSLVEARSRAAVMQGGRDSGERGGAEEDSNPLTLLAVIIKEQKKGVEYGPSPVY